MSEELSEFQKKALGYINNKISQNRKRTLIEMPVGSGKTFLLLKVMDALLGKKDFNSITIVFSSPSLRNYYINSINEFTNINDSVEYDYGTYSIKLILNNSNNKNIYLVDDAFNAEVYSVLKIKKTIIIGIYSIASEKVQNAFDKKKPNIIYEKEELAKFNRLDKIIEEPSLVLSRILGKLSIKVNDDEKLEKLLLSLDLWAEEYLLKLKQIDKENYKTHLIETIIYRKKAIEEFKKLLFDKKHFEEVKGDNKTESVWQNFFEKNKWIFGLNLNLFLLSSLENKKLEQVVSGYDFNSGGKRVDGLLKSNGLLKSFHFCEIKTHQTKLLKSGSAYRVDSFSISEEFAGAIAQIQKTVHKAMRSQPLKQSIIDTEGFNTDEVIYNYIPQATLVIGSLQEFTKNGNIHEERYASFELFRKSFQNIQIITFDELYARAEAIIGISKNAI